MGATATYAALLNRSYGMDSFISRGGKFAAGILVATYSAAGGVTFTTPFASKTLFCMFNNPSGYQFEYIPSTQMLKAFNILASTTAAGLCPAEVASDTDFSCLTGAAGIPFCCFGS
jgi:hypothetical protein